MDALESELREVGRTLAAALPSAARHPLKAVDDRAMDLASSDAELKAALFRFVDVVPACRNLDDLARHLTGFLGELEAPAPPISAAMRMGNSRAGRTALGAAAAAGVKHMAHRFIVGESPQAAMGDLRSLWKHGVASTVDLLGEATVTQAEAQRYADRCNEALETLTRATAGWPEKPALERDSSGPLPRANLSVKVSALTPLMRPDAPERGQRDAAERLRPLLRNARELGAHLHIDMESLDSRDAVTQLILDLLAEDEFRDGPSAGIVLQAYLRDSPGTCDLLLAWSVDGPGARRAHPLTVRLVKGAYWDHEIVQARQHGWEPPVFDVKADSDLNFEALTRRLIDARGAVRVAVGSHNLRSVAHAVAYNRMTGGDDKDLELQVLRGLGDPLQEALATSGFRVRAYCPVGDLVAGMAYLVRRLLENTSNDSFLLAQASGASVDDLLARPEMKGARHLSFTNEPVLELRRAPVRASLAGALADLDRELPLRVGGDAIVSVDPCHSERVVATAGIGDVDAALDRATRAFPKWRDTPVAERAAALRQAAAFLREHRLRAAALALRECGKPWPEADADVCEAIDFLEYYAQGAMDLGAELLQMPGERNTLHYTPRGVTAVIAPWNFPLAIPLGMAAAALATGNVAILKPAEQSPGCAGLLAQALAHLPEGVFQVVTGEGDTGAALVADPRVHTIAFTGSGPVGLGIIRSAADIRPGQDHLKRVVAEMGGKNCLIVDSDADLDEVVPAVVSSAFTYAGQKCSAASRVLVHEAIHDALLERLAGAVELLEVAPAERPSVDVPAVIEAASVERHAKWATAGRLVAQVTDIPDGGFYAPPTLVADLPADHELLRTEVFGPLLAVERVRDVAEACDRVDASSYALTGGLFSRNPDVVEAVVRRSPVGNLYVNRSITGAMVGRQPFGGNRLSGTGTKAGGPGYLLQFVEPRVITENTMRHGLVV